MAIEQSADNTAVQNTRKCLMVLFGIPFSDNFITVDKAANAQPFFIRRSTAEADAAGRIALLE